MPAKDIRRYIIMSNEGFLSDLLTATELVPSAKTVNVMARAAAVAPAPKMQVLDSLHENGPKLVEMSPEAELSLRLSKPGLKIVPEVFYHRQWERFKIHKRLPATGARTAVGKSRRKMKVAKAVAAPSSVTVTVTDASGGAPIKGAQIVAFTDFAARQGRQRDNSRKRPRDAPGPFVEPKARTCLRLCAGRLLGILQRKHRGIEGVADQVDKNRRARRLAVAQSALRLAPGNAGEGVTVGVIDSGVDGTHPDLTNVSGGLNCVSDEVRANPAAAQNWRPAKKEGEHGTHVAGIVGGRGTASGFRGVAPGVTLRSYRVFPDKGGGASNFDIAKAIDTAIADKCDIINMSLGGGPKDDLTRAAIIRALNSGAIVVVAAGNDDRDPVSFPAAFTECTAVSAMGRIGSFPKTAIGTSSVATPKGNPLAKDFVADFSNFGPEIDVTGAGVEIVSTLPGTGHGSMSGTSMACPAVAGFAAHLLAADPALKQNVGADRSRALKDALYASCKPEGFGRDFEGFGLPVP